MSSVLLDLCLAPFVRRRYVIAMSKDGHIDLFTNLYHYYVTFVMFVCQSTENTNIKKVKTAHV